MARDDILDVPSLKQLGEKNEQVNILLDRCCSDAADMLTNLNSCMAYINHINEKLGSITKYKADIREIRNCPTNLQNMINELANDYKKFLSNKL